MYKNTVLSRKEIYLLLVILCFLVYANSLNNEFVSDDIPAILNNPDISSPTKYLFYPHSFLNSLCYLATKFNPSLYHLISIIVHSVVTILVYRFLSLFFKPEASILGACLFAVHPIHTEAVTWISGRNYSITALFILMVFFLYYQATSGMKNGKRINFKKYLISLIPFSYYIFYNFSFYFLFPFLLILFDFTFNRWRKTWKWWLPFLGIASLKIIILRGAISDRALSVAKEMGAPVAWANPIFNLTYSLFSHLRLLLWPAKLTLYHEPHVISLFALRLEMGFLIILGLGLFFIFRKAKEIFFGIGIFALFLVPTYSPVTISWLLAERYLYFPSVMLSIFLAFFYERYILNSKRFKRLGLAFCVLIIASYAVRTVARNEDWKTPQRFWRQTVIVSYNSPKAHINMGDVYSQEANTTGAIREFKKAIELKPDYADAYHNLATIYYRLGDIEEAIGLYKQAVSFNPQIFESHINLGVIYLNKKEYDLAGVHFRRATELRPDDVNAKAGLNLAIQKQNEK